MKKLLLFIMMFTLVFVFANTTNVSAATQVEEFVGMYSGITEETDSYGSSSNSQFRVYFDDLETTQGGTTCSTTPTTKIKVRSRSVAGATGSTVYATLNGGYVYGYNSFHYGDEDIYLEVTLLNVNGDCDVTIVFDVDR